MKIRKKAVFIIVMSSLLVMLLNLATLKILIINYIENAENDFVYKNNNRAIRILDKEKTLLISTLLDWSQWDDTYNFIKDHNNKYIKANLNKNTLKTLDLNFMIFQSSKGNTVFSIENYPQSFNYQYISKKLLDEVKKNRLSLENGVTSTSNSGIVVISGTPILLSLSLITTTDGMSPKNGYLIIGKVLDKSFSSYMEDVLSVSFKIENKNSNSGLNIIKSYKKLNSHNQINWIKKTNSKIINYAQINDIWGKQSIFLKFTLDRDIYRQGILAVKYFLIVFILGLIFVSTCTFVIFDKFMTKPIKALHNFVKNVGENKDMSSRINLSRNDEISDLAKITNVMLEKLDTSYSKIKIAGERFRLIMEATNDGYFDMNIKEGTIYISHSWLKYNGYESEIKLMTLEKTINYIHQNDREAFLKAVKDCLKGTTDKLIIEHRVLQKNGSWLWVAVRGKVAEYNELGIPIRLIGTISDINRHKAYEDEIIYLSQTDPVTSLKNRTYMESQISRINEYVDGSIWIIMGDLNGLKLVNDSFGHLEGDKLLAITGEIIKKCCEKDDIAVRWGGDEFIILIKNKDSKYVENLIAKIKTECDNNKDFTIKISLAFGKACKDKTNTNFNNILKIAEKRMYRNKLLESRSARSAILFSLAQSLHEKHIETEAHTIRIKNMCIDFGRRLGLSQEELDELALLGMLHDIGKIAIPEAVLLKPDKLTEKEWEVMKTHSEIGYRIAASTPELAHIADEILSHHERYDGNGYPHKLKGDEIPKLSRLLTIVDSFDVMTHDRHYKKAMSLDAAIEELITCSGKQFDPQMTQAFIDFLKNT